MNNLTGLPNKEKPSIRLWRLVGEVHAGEVSGVLILAANAFLLLASYYLLKTVREALILTEGGATVKAYSSALQAAFFIVLIPAYSAFAARVNRVGLMTWVSLAFAAQLVAFYVAGVAGLREGVAFFLWVGVFNVFLVGQFWSFANDLYSEAAGKRLFPPIMLGSSLGALAGARLASYLIGRVGAYNLMLVTAACLLVCLALTRLTHARAIADAKHFVRVAPEARLARGSAWQMLASDRYLMLIAILTVLLNVVNTSGEFLLGKFVADQATLVAGSNIELQRRFVGEFYGDFFGWVNLVGVLLQTFAVSRIFRAVGVRGALFLLPCIAFLGSALLLFMPVLGVVRVAKVLENGTDYSVQNTARHALFLSTSREAKYKAKAAIDTFFMRAGDMIQAGIVFVGTNLGLSVAGFAAVNLVLASIWLVTVFLLASEHNRRNSAPALALEVA